ncbi:hypothetical protein [Rhizobium leguminosarum]
MRALISPTARRAAIFDEKDQKWIFKSAGSKEWQTADSSELDRVFKGSRDYEEVEADHADDVDRQLRIKSDSARALSMLDIALTAPDKENAVWAGTIVKDLISDRATKKEVEKFLFATPMPTVGANRLEELRALGVDLSWLLRDLNRAQPRILLVTREFERSARHNRLTSVQKSAALATVVQTGLFRELVRLESDRADILNAIKSARPANIHPSLTSTLYDRITKRLFSVAAKDYERSEENDRPSRSMPLLSPVLSFFELIYLVARAIISLLTLRL